MLAVTAEPPRLEVSERLERWIAGPQPKTIGGLIDLFGEKGFAAAFVLLLAVAALPLPTGGVTHVMELVALLLSVQLVVGRKRIWLPRRLRQRELTSLARTGTSERLLGGIRRIEDLSRPRLSMLLRHPLSGVFFGVSVFGLTLTAFLAPPFTGLDTLPAMGVVVLSMAVLLDDGLLVLIGLAIGVTGAAMLAGLAGLVLRLA